MALASIALALTVTVALHADYQIEAPDVLTVEVSGVPKPEALNGEHLVRPDGTVSLGTYGAVPVTGLSAQQAQAAIKKHLRRFIAKPNPLRVRVSVLAYNSKLAYVFTDDGVSRIPLDGKTTVLDAVRRVEGLAAAAKGPVIVSRPRDGRPNQRLDVDWKAITEKSSAATNYRLLPGDRLYVGTSPSP
jgi:polysaccharide export outer membrane protein